MTLFAPDVLRETLGEGGALREEAREARLVNKGEFEPSVECCCSCCCEDAEMRDARFETAGDVGGSEGCGSDPLATGAPDAAGAAVVDVPVLSALSR